MPPHFVQTNAAIDATFTDPNFSDLYLSTTVDPEEASFQSSGIRLTPVNDDDKTSTHIGPTSPLAFDPNSASTPANNNSNNNGYGTSSYSEFLSPVDDFTSDLSGHNSPVADFIAPGVWQPDGHHNQNIQHPAPDRYTAVSSAPPSPQMTMNPSQLLTPVLTNNPSPSSDTSSVRSGRELRTVHHPPIPPLITTPVSDSLGVHPGPDSARAISPIVKVESYSRGDSPVRDSLVINRRPSQSSVHLSPGGMSNASDEDDGPGIENKSISRAHNGAWVPNRATGQAGVEPSSRQDIYVPSPNEVDSQRKLAERNADIWTWSEAVSEANSEAGDDLPWQRGRTDHHGTRRRAKSAGDPSLQQDYFNLKYFDNRTTVPGPGLVINETSEYSEDESGSPAVSVNEDRWTLEASDISPSAEHPANEGHEPLPHQFLGTAPWQDPERDSSPRTTKIQPPSSTAAMAEYQRRAKELDTASRWATWGTRDVDANSIRSFQNLTISGKGKKHERRNSLLKFLPKKQTNTLKRQRQQSDLSMIHTGVDSPNQGNENKPTTPQRKDSFPHRKLSLGLSIKSPTYSTGGAVIAMTKQIAAIGGKDSLSVVPPNSTTNPWASFKARGRSRSEVPRAPGLLELMTSHGGPPVPNLNYSSQPKDNDRAQHTGQQNDVGDDDDDDELDDEKGLVMEFPILPNLPVPTLEGFKTQILQLNPRLSAALIERFAHEQLRRYKKLIEIKQNHAQAVKKGSCKAGKYCFAQGGQAKLLPPRASTQDPEFTYTQFQIPGRGEAEDGTGALGETTIAMAQFPPGVPYPPPEVKLLPAEFECPVCFQVKKFQKPSDWTKHIYEDVQPFTCTFPDCTDPKSFKRKADWVRHESERHRQLEWWECTMPDCRHKCYRKDNFVQHLVREHKMPEPKIKKSKNKGSAGRGPNDPVTPEMQEEMNREREVKRLWDLVDNCRHDTAKGPREEPCRFCGNVCTNWKKLTVHLAKHMEQIAIPILGLVDEREFPYGNNGTCSTGKADPCSGQMSIMHESGDFTPSLNNGVSDGVGATINFTQAQYTGSSQNGGTGSLAVPFAINTTYIPATSIPLQGGGLVSAEPDAMDGFEDASSFGPPELAEDQTRMMMAMHQNSVTYPPPFNTGPRPRISNQNLRVLQDYNANNFSMSPTEMQYDAPSAVYVSTTAENHYAYQGPMASTVPYNPPGAYHDQDQ